MQSLNEDGKTEGESQIIRLDKLETSEHKYKKLKFIWLKTGNLQHFCFSQYFFLNLRLKIY